MNQLAHNESTPIDRSTLQHDVAHVLSIIQHARILTTATAQQVQHTLHQDFKRRARMTATSEDDDVIEWIRGQVSNRSLEEEYDDDLDVSASKKKNAKHVKPLENETIHDFRTTLLCMKWIRRVRARVYRRALLKSDYQSIVKLRVTDAINAVLARVDEWDFDLFALERLAGQRVLSVLAYHILEDRLGYLKTFDVQPAAFANFITAIEDGYLDVPYHSHIHAADVLQNTYYFLTRPSMKSKVTPLDIFAGCLAAAVHDYAHPGTNNAFQIMTESPSAIRYNDRSVLENLHISESFLIMKRPHHNVLGGLSDKDRLEVRSTMVAMVLATDMSAHFKNLSELRTQIETHQTKGVEWTNTSAHDRLMCLETTLHCADLGNVSQIDRTIQ